MGEGQRPFRQCSGHRLTKTCISRFCASPRNTLWRILSRGQFKVSSSSRRRSNILYENLTNFFPSFVTSSSSSLRSSSSAPLSRFSFVPKRVPFPERCSIFDRFVVIRSPRSPPSVQPPPPPKPPPPPPAVAAVPSIP